MRADTHPGARMPVLAEPRPGRASTAPAPSGRVAPIVPSLLAFAGAVALVLVYALRGGSYDLVIREENGLVVWWLLALGLGLGLLPRARLSRPALLLLGALTCYAGWTALSLTWTDSTERTFGELTRVIDYLGLVALIASVLDRHTWRAAAAGLMFGALAVCVLSVWSRLAPAGFPADAAGAAFRIDRLSYPFGYWNTAGAWGAMSAALALSWSAHDTVSVRRALALALAPVAGTMTYLSYSRSGVGAIALAVLLLPAVSRNRLTAVIHTVIAVGATGFAVLAVRGAPEIARATGTAGAANVVGALVFGGAGCAAVALLTRRTKTDRWRMPSAIARRIAVIAAVPIVLAAAGLGPHFAGQAWHSFKKTGIVKQTDNPTSRLTTLSGSRYDIWDVALNGFSAKPVTGTGAGTFEFLWNRHQRSGEFVRNAHSVWFENLAELGLPGLVFIVSVVAMGGWLAVMTRLKARRSVTAGVATAAIVAFSVYLVTASVDWMWQSTAITVLAFGGVAVLSPRLGGPRPRLRWPVRGALLILAVGAGLVQIPLLLATLDVRHSQTAAAAGDTPAALSWARDAISQAPWDASAHMQRGLVLESQGKLDQAAKDIGQAISHEKTDFAGWIVLARIDTERGRYETALQDRAQARKLRTRGQVFQLSPSFGKF